MTRKFVRLDGDDLLIALSIAFNVLKNVEVDRQNRCLSLKSLGTMRLSVFVALSLVTIVRLHC